MEDTGALLVFGLIVVVLLVAGGFWLVLNHLKQPRQDPMAQWQAEQLASLTARLQALAESQVNLQGAINQRLDSVTHRLGEGFSQNAEKTAKSLGEIQERLNVIDKAQDNLVKLSNDVVGLQDILSNKQARGAFGEIQLNDLVSQVLPPSAYEFQVTLANGKRADCLIHLPNPPGSIAIDAKFPLESYRLLRAAERGDERKLAERAFRVDVLKHVADIAERYVAVEGTADSALMFLPSEAVYAELHANFREVVEKSFAAKVWIVSPTTMMATLNTVRAILRDVRMREQAGLIQKEVAVLMEDIRRLDKRVDNLQTHFNQASRDIDEIVISSKKVTSRAGKIEELELDKAEPVVKLVVEN
ncbi:DNA recombination protein RmuC [Emcibacter sp. SYSU 3D8]|uniref:DNA recombination protein RmuC n=1 Tax=Emcibacter sp. SYSU 3D8 TaxID=3133969 RepID=UPI0031FE752C